MGSTKPPEKTQKKSVPDLWAHHPAGEGGRPRHSYLSCLFGSFVDFSFTFLGSSKGVAVEEAALSCEAGRAACGDSRPIQGGTAFGQSRLYNCRPQSAATGFFNPL